MGCSRASIFNIAYESAAGLGQLEVICHVAVYVDGRDANPADVASLDPALGQRPCKVDRNREADAVVALA